MKKIFSFLFAIVILLALTSFVSPKSLAANLVGGTNVPCSDKTLQCNTANSTNGDCTCKALGGGYGGAGTQCTRICNDPSCDSLCKSKNYKCGINTIQSISCNCGSCGSGVCLNHANVESHCVTCVPNSKRCSASTSVAQTCNSAGDAWVNEVCVFGDCNSDTHTCPVPPSAPSNLNVTSSCTTTFSSQVTFSWNAVPGANHYHISWVEGTTSGSADPSSNSYSTTVPNLTVITSWNVETCSASGCTAATNGSSVTSKSCSGTVDTCTSTAGAGQVCKTGSAGVSSCTDLNLPDGTGTCPTANGITPMCCKAVGPTTPPKGSHDGATCLPPAKTVSDLSGIGLSTNIPAAWGWACIPGASTTIVVVLLDHLYVAGSSGAVSVGSLTEGVIGTTQATAYNTALTASDCADKYHGWVLNIPSQLQNKAYKIYAYGVNPNTGAYTLLGNSPKDYEACTQAQTCESVANQKCYVVASGEERNAFCADKAINSVPGIGTCAQGFTCCKGNTCTIDWGNTPSTFTVGQNPKSTVKFTSSNSYNDKYVCIEGANTKTCFRAETANNTTPNLTINLGKIMSPSGERSQDTNVPAGIYTVKGSLNGSLYTSDKSEIICSPSKTITVCPAGGCSNPPGPTPPPADGHTRINFKIGLDGIGVTGDRPNPDHYKEVKNAAGVVVGAGSNFALKRPSRSFTITINSVKHTQDFTFDNTSTSATYGLFTGTIDLGTTFATADYTIYASAEAHLVQKFPAAIHIVNGTTTTAPRLNLVAGDVTGDGTGDIDISDAGVQTPGTVSVAGVEPDNKLTIFDYTVLMSCLHDPDINDFDNGATCKKDGKNGVDFTRRSNLEDNAVSGNDIVDKYDYNLFVREFSKVQNGD